jgi:hypothetical protein
MGFSIAFLVMGLAIMFLVALSVWIACLCHPKVTARRFFSDVYSTTAKLVAPADQSFTAPCTVVWSRVERVVSLSISLQMDLNQLASPKTGDLPVTLKVDLVFPPMKPEPRYLKGFGLSKVSSAKCFLSPIPEAGKSEASLVVVGLDPRSHPHENFEINGTLVI